MPVLPSLCLLLMAAASGWCVPMSEFYPFGDMAGDSRLTALDTDSALVELATPLRLSVQNQTSLYVRLLATILMLPNSFQHNSKSYTCFFHVKLQADALQVP